MADALQAQETGGGEGSTPVQAVQESKSTEPAKQNDEKKEAAGVSAPVVPTSAAPAVAATVPEIPAATVPAPVVPVPTVPTPEVPVPEVPAPTEPISVEQATTATTPAVPATIDQNANNVEGNAAPSDSNWQQRELELLKKIEELEKVKNERSEDGLKLELKVREEEIDLLKARVRNLETELHAALSKPSGKNHEMIENIKQQHEELLSKARGMIFDKTKMVKNQELQIEALTTQVQSLKDINLITKDLLEIRNSEVKAMEDRLQAMEARFKAEKERFGLVLQRAQTSSNINDDLKKEYETQLAIFKELREKYEQRVQALVAENERLKAANASAASTSPAQ